MLPRASVSFCHCGMVKDLPNTAEYVDHYWSANVSSVQSLQFRCTYLDPPKVEVWRKCRRWWWAAR
jgi:hypothetical protein